jgi:hypothetical protein
MPLGDSIMPTSVRRGEIMFLVIATLLIGSSLFDVGASLLGGWDKIKLWRNVVAPLAFAGCIAGLWFGNRTVQWIMVAGCVLPGLWILIGTARAWNKLQRAGLIGDSEPEALIRQSIGIMASLGALRVILGLLLGFLPSGAEHPVLWKD